MEEKIYYTFMPSLEHRTLTKVAVTLWNKDDVRVLVQRFFFERYISYDRETMCKWEKIEIKVVEKVAKLLLPKPLKEKLLYFVRCTGLQILIWVSFHESFVKKLPFQFFWTAQCTIDKEKTAEILVNDESLSIHERYKLACTYCLEDHISVLWKQLRQYPYKKDLAYARRHEPPFLVSFWSHYLEGKIDQLDYEIKEYCGYYNVTPYEYAFRRSALAGNLAATRYFFQKLTPGEKEKILVRIAESVASRRDYRQWLDSPREYHTDVFCFLLLQMDEVQQIEVFKSHPYEVLKCFLDWPRQSFFMKTAEHVWDFLSEEDYYRLLWWHIIYEKVIEGHEDFNYRKLFREFWQQSPGTHKKYAINQCMSGDLLLWGLFKVGDEVSIRLIFKDAIAAEREKCIFSIEGKDTCQDLIFDGKWDLLKFFVQECTSSKDVIIRFKEEFKEHLAWRRSKETLEREKDMWNMFFRLLDDFIQKDDEKRSAEEGDSCPAKRFCS